MFRRLLGKVCEWALGYNRIVYYDYTGIVFTPVTLFNKKISYKGDAGYDLYVNEQTVIPSRSVKDVSTGIYIDPKASIWFEIKARSSTFKNLGLEVQDAVIDKGYRGELFAIVHNSNDFDVVISFGSRICQIVPHLLLPCKFILGKLSKSERGDKGFGSTGK
jgi:dUTP pyrophosphatase